EVCDRSTLHEDVATGLRGWARLFDRGRPFVARARRARGLFGELGHGARVFRRGALHDGVREVAGFPHREGAWGLGDARAFDADLQWRRAQQVIALED